VRNETLTGIGFDPGGNPDGEGWGITDGSAGLRGRLIKTGWTSPKSNCSPPRFSAEHRVC